MEVCFIVVVYSNAVRHKDIASGLSPGPALLLCVALATDEGWDAALTVSMLARGWLLQQQPGAAVTESGSSRP